MTNYKRILLILMLAPCIGFSQTTTNLDEVQPGRFDQGKMWTFENPPTDYFQEAYSFTLTEEWMEDVRKSALRFGTWCSSSFVSANGLIMTNHHCSRGVVASVMKEGENFDENGFYAEKLEDERRVPDLFVDQMIMLADITDEVKGMDNVSPDEALAKVQEEYQQKDGWKDLVLETRTFYSGGKYSLYGYKRHTDIRLVLYPELALGFFGGDPDNFTYPRYNLDFTFFRAYDEDGNPVKPTNFFAFKPEGAVEDEPVFVVGNPGSTGRYLTMSQLYYQRDVSAPAILSLLSNRKEILLKVAETEEDVYKKDSITNIAFSYSNAEKAYTGRLEGLMNPYLMTKKEKKEAQLRQNVSVEGDNPWNEIEDNVKEMQNYYAETLFLSPSGTRGKVNQLLHKLVDYQMAIAEENEETLAKNKEDIMKILDGFDTSLERALFAVLLEELQKHSRQDYIADFLGGNDSI